MIKHYFISAFRNIFKNRVSAIIAILGLVAGIVCFSFCTYHYRNLYSLNKGYKDSERLVSFSTLYDDGGKIGYVHTGLAHDLRKYDLNEIENITVIDHYETLNFKIERDNDSPFYSNINCHCADTAVTDVLGIDILAGDINNAKKMPNSALMTKSVADRIFGQESPIGKTIFVAGYPFHVTINGIINDFPDNISLPGGKPEMLLLSYEWGRINPDDFYSIIGATGIAKLKPGFKKNDLNRRLSEVKFTFDFGDSKKTVLSESYATPKKESVITTLLTFICALGLFVLISAIVNYFIFIIGISKNRSTEYALRNILGSSKSSLFILLFIEIFITLAITWGITMIITELTGNEFDSSFNKGRLNMIIDKSVLIKQQCEYFIYALILSVPVLGIISGRISKTNFQKIKTNNNNYFRNIILTLQFVICFLFLSGASILYFQSQMIESRILTNFTESEKDRIYFINSNINGLKENADELKFKLQNTSFVEDILSITYPLSSHLYSSFTINEESKICGVRNASSNFREFANLQLKEQRSVAESNSALVLISPEHQENEFPDDIYHYQSETPIKVKGIYDYIYFNQSSGSNGNYCHLILPIEENEDYNMYVKINESYTGDAPKEISNLIKNIYPKGLEPEVNTLKHEYDNLNEVSEYIKKLLFVFGIICLIVTLAGVYSAINNDTEKRKKEVTIRKINGASYFNIALMFCRSYIVMIFIGSCFAFPVVWMLSNKVLDEYFCRFDINNPLFWISVFLMIILFVFLTMFIKVRNIVKLDPCKGLRSE